MGLVLGVDIGTTTTVGLLVDVSSGEVVRRRLVNYAPGYRTPEEWPSGAEQDPKIWLASFNRVALECSIEAEKMGQPIDALAVSSLFGGLNVPVDESFTPLRNVPIWLDHRAVREGKALEAKIGPDRLHEVTGNAVVSPYFGFVKLLWYMVHEPERFRRTKGLVTPSGLVIHRLTERHVTDLSSLGNFGGVLDVRKGGLSEELVSDIASLATSLAGDRLEIDPALFGTIVPSDQVVGEVSPVGTALTYIPEGVPVVASGVNTPVSLVAAGSARPGDNALLMGSAWCWGTLQGMEGARPAARLVNLPHVLGSGELVLSFGGGDYIGAAASYWLPKHVTAVPLEDLVREAEMVPPGSDGLTFHPFLIGERAPLWRHDLSGSFVGLRAAHSRAHMFRAILEGGAFLHEECLEAAIEAGYGLGQPTSVAGVGEVPELWRTIVADVTGRPLLLRPKYLGAPYGDGMLAAVGSGAASLDEVLRWLPEGKLIQPTTDQTVLKAYEAARERFWLTQRALARPG